MTRAVSDPQSVVAFWQSAGPARWFKADPEFDAEISRKFLATLEPASINDLTSWEGSAKGALALVLVLNQFSRHIYRETAKAFETDSLAREVALRAIKRGFDGEVEEPLRHFFYFPFMHSEDMADQERSLAYFRGTGDQDYVKPAEIHFAILRGFGRFPHRNEALGRSSSPEELAFLADGGAHMSAVA